MKSIVPYLRFNGNCEEAFNFYRSVFGGEFRLIKRLNEVVPEGRSVIPEDTGKRIIHISLFFGDMVLMGSDTGNKWTSNAPINNIILSLKADSKERADYLYRSLSEGGNIIIPLKEIFWKEYYGVLSDRFGIKWMVSFRPES